jgi:hypothetical protein
MIQEIGFAPDSPLEGRVYCELVSEMGIPASSEKARFRGVMDDYGSVAALFWAHISPNLVFRPRQLLPAIPS